jgi:hypothetical protein
MSEREPEKDPVGGAAPFRDSDIQGEEQLHSSFDDLETPAPDTDPFADQDSSEPDSEGEEDDPS